MYPDPRFTNPQEHRDALRRSYERPTMMPERGGCLTFWLGVQALFTGIAAIYFLNVLGQLGRVRSPGLGLYLLILAALIAGMIACLIGIWRWKRWGVYGIVAISIASFIAEFIFSTPTLNITDCLQPIVGNLILYYLIHNQWDYYT